MATRSVVGYYNEADDFRGTYVHYDGYPDHAVPELEKRLAEVGYEGLVQWIEDGIAHGGYISYEDDKPADADEPTLEDAWLMSLDDEEYGYVVRPGDTVELEHAF